ncbi:hypothetical protein NEOLEDRAFT_1076085, partial [Neolentinus lepideus HHB14362 ss-1]
MDRLPVELWTRICGFACTDDGFTGRSLSLVSKYVYEVSDHCRYQSVALAGIVQMTSFLSLL